jgi:hypothetical protein
MSYIAARTNAQHVGTNHDVVWAATQQTEVHDLHMPGWMLCT